MLFKAKKVLWNQNYALFLRGKYVIPTDSNLNCLKMKRILLVLALVLSCFCGIQAQWLQPTVDAPFVKVLTPTTKGTIQPGANQVWWGYYTDGMMRDAIGTQTAETVEQAIFIKGNDPFMAGKKIQAIRFFLRSLKDVSEVRVWLAKPNAAGQPPANTKQANVSVTCDLTKLQAGDQDQKHLGIANDIALTQPFEVPAEGVFVGVTFEIEALSDPINASPIVTTGSGTDIDNSLWVRTAVRIPNWTDAANKGFGRAAIQVLSEGAIPENALDAKDFDPVYMKPGKRTIVPVTATMAGTKQVNSLAFTMKVGNHEPSKEQTVDLPQPLTLFGQELQLNIPVNAPTQSGEYPVEVTITKVNGEANGSPHATSKGAFVVLEKEIVRNVVVEEYTGTGCGYCPRGIAGMMKLRDTFGDRFIGIGIHRYNDSDPMFISKYERMAWSGAPKCILNRGNQIDPFNGSGEGIVKDFQEEMERTSAIEVSVSGAIDDAKTHVYATANINPLVSGNFKLAYVLVADEVFCPKDNWRQMNYYSARRRETQPEEMAQFCMGGAQGTKLFEWHYDDVAISSSYDNNGKNQVQIGALEAGKTLKHSFTIDMPTDAELLSAVQTNKLYVVAMVIAPDGRIENAAKSQVTPIAGIQDIEGSQKLTEVARYTIDGRRISQPQKGVNIVKLSDGTTFKVLVK